MSLITYFSPVVTWSASIAIGVVLIPPMMQGFVVGGGSTFIEQAKQDVISLLSFSNLNLDFTPPLQGSTAKTSPFGMRKHPVTGAYTLHNGIDYRCTVGDPVFSVTDGVINHAGGAGNAGLLVAVDHADGLQSLYMHLSAALVANGQQVRGGQLIGKCGDSGRSTGAHLHLSLKQNGQFIDPTTKGL